MAFKMKRTPIKGKLDNFFSSLGKEATSDRQTKQIQENQGMTNFEKKMADKAAQRKSGGKSKFQRAAAERKANKAATAAGDARNAADDKARLDANAKAKAYKPKKKKKVVKKVVKKEKKVTTPKVVKNKVKTDLTKVKGSTTYVDPNKGKVIGKKKADETLNLDPVLDLNKKTKSKKHKAPKKRANIFSSGLDLTGKYLNKLDRAFGFNPPEFMKKYDK